MKTFLRCAVLLMLPLAAQAEDTRFERHQLGKYYGITIPGGAPLSIELRESDNALDTVLYVGAATASARNLSFSLGVSGRITPYIAAPASTNASLLDPRSPAMQAQYQMAREKLTSIESSNMRYGFSFRRFEPAFRIKYFTDHHRRESVELKTEKNQLDKERVMLYYKREIFPF